MRQSVKSWYNDYTKKLFHNNYSTKMVIYIYIVAAAVLLQLVAAQNLLIPTTVIASKSNSDGSLSDSCPSQEELDVAIKSIKNRVNDMQSEIQLVPRCGDGLWYQVAYINMNNIRISQQCPSTWRKYTYPSGIQVCGRLVSSGGSCSSKSYSIDHQYHRVCGRAIAYQFESPDAFHSGRTIDQIYMDGISITHGSPRVHIWSYVGAWTENIVSGQNVCPCRYSGAPPPPSFVGDNYYCESANPTNEWQDLVLTDDKLWDGQDCDNEGICCTAKSPPWFSVELLNPTSDDIEVRICGNESTSNEDTPVKLLELYVQ